MARKKKNEVKLPKIEQLPSGAWHTRVLIDGRRVSITKDSYNECAAEYMALKHSIIEAAANPGVKTVSKAIDDYIEARQNVLSPATIRCYRAVQKNRFQAMMQRDIHSISPDQWQRTVNLEAKTVSAKTLTNAWVFISSVVAEATGQRVNVRLPQIVPAEKPWLTPEQIPVFVAAIKGNKAEIPALLALSSLRRAEIAGLKWDDIDLGRNIINVTATIVPDENHKFVYRREMKNVTSRRIVPIIPPLQEALAKVERKEGFVVKNDPNTYMMWINRVCEKSGLPRVGLHGLRHSFASLAYHLGMSEKVAMQIGGWADHQTMHKIYTHISQKDIASAAQDFTDFFNQIGNSSGNRTK